MTFNLNNLLADDWQNKLEYNRISGIYNVENNTHINYTHRTTECFDDRILFRRQMPINLEGRW